MDKDLKKKIEHLLSNLSDGCCSEEDNGIQYDGWPCYDIPNLPLQKWCNGCLALSIRGDL